MTEIKQEVSTLVKEFFADECEVDVNDITDNARLASLMFLSLGEHPQKAQYGSRNQNHRQTLDEKIG
jgi:hypothetical protein